jgi:hypothetical protein
MANSESNDWKVIYSTMALKPGTVAHNDEIIAVQGQSISLVRANSPIIDYIRNNAATLKIDLASYTMVPSTRYFMIANDVIQRVQELLQPPVE